MSKVVFVFIEVCFENKKRRKSILCLFSLIGYRQVTIHVNKQEQFTPIGHEPSEQLDLTCEYFAGIHKRENKSRKLKYLKSTNGEWRTILLG